MAYVVGYRFMDNQFSNKLLLPVSLKGRWGMTKSKIDNNGTIVWGVFEKIIAWAIVSFLTITLATVTTVAVLIFKVDSYHTEQIKDLIVVNNSIDDIEMSMRNSLRDRYTGTQAAADRAAAATDRSQIHNSLESQSKIIVELQILTTRLNEMTKQSLQKANESKQERREMEKNINKLLSKGQSNENKS